MSTQAVADFILKANDDPEFSTKFEGSTIDDRIASVVAAGHEHGFEFTPTECRDFLDTARSVGDRELSAEEMEMVAGGGTVSTALGKILFKISEAVFGEGTVEEGSDAGPDIGVAGIR